MDKNSETFVIHIIILKTSKIKIYSFYTAQIVALQWEKAFTKILTEYQNYADVFSADLAIKLPENTSINEYVIELMNRN